MRLCMSNIIEYREKLYEFQNKKKISRKQHKYYKDEKSFVCRLPYPLNVHVLIDIVERMGIQYESIVLPLLKEIAREVEVRERNV